jgi:hypothetical protein
MLDDRKLLCKRECVWDDFKDSDLSSSRPVVRVGATHRARQHWPKFEHIGLVRLRFPAVLASATVGPAKTLDGATFRILLTSLMGSLVNGARAENNQIPVQTICVIVDGVPLASSECVSCYWDATSRTLLLFITNKRK